MAQCSFYSALSSQLPRIPNLSLFSSLKSDSQKPDLSKRAAVIRPGIETPVAAAGTKVFVVSDLHTDYPENMSWVKSLPRRTDDNDVLVVAGDVAETSANFVQTEEEMRKGELEADKDRMMRDYRAQLDAERARKLAHGKNHSSTKSTTKKDKKDRDSKKHSSKKRKRSRRESSDSSSTSSSETSSSDDEERERKRSKSRSKKSKREKKHRSRSSKQLRSGNDGEAEGPLPLSRFFGSLKS